MVTVSSIWKGRSGSVWGSGSAIEPGIVSHAVRDVFNFIRSNNEERSFLLRVCMCEIYNEVVRDLLADQVDVSDARRGTHKENVKGRGRGLLHWFVHPQIQDLLDRVDVSWYQPRVCLIDFHYYFFLYYSLFFQ